MIVECQDGNRNGIRQDRDIKGITAGCWRGKKPKDITFNPLMADFLFLTLSLATTLSEVQIKLLHKFIY